MKERERLPLPVYGAVLREGGDAVVEARVDGELVGELNVSKILQRWWGRLSERRRQRSLRVV